MAASTSYAWHSAAAASSSDAPAAVSCHSSVAAPLSVCSLLSSGVTTNA
jgi:hypothetical protein